MNRTEKYSINEAMAQTWKRWQGYTPEQKAERLSYLQQQIVQLKQQRAYAKSKVKTARTPEEQQVWRNTKVQIDKELLRLVSHEHDLRVGKKMSKGAKERAAIKRREDRAKAKNRIIFQPQDNPYYTNETKNMNKKLIRLTEGDLHKIVKESVNRILKEGYYDFYDDFNADDVECPYCGSNNVEAISAIDTHYHCLDCDEEFYLDSGWEPDWDAMRHESHTRKGKILKELNRSTMQSAYDKMVQQGRRSQAASMNDTFNDMYNGYDAEGNFVNQTDLSGRGRHYFLNRSNQGESTISNSESTYGDETNNYNPNVASSYLGKQNDDLAQKAQQIQDWQYGKNNAAPYRTNSNMTPSYVRSANQDARRKEMKQRRLK